MSGAPDRIEHNPALIPPLQPASPNKTGEAARTADGKSFDQILRTKVAEQIAPASTEVAAGAEHSVKWSAHAQARLRQRGIEMTEAQLVRLEQAVDRAASKGGRDSLVMMDDTALVVSVKNRTVITALHREQARDNVFTNIDSAVIA
jgi:flagellar operon protein